MCACGCVRVCVRVCVCAWVCVRVRCIKAAFAPPAADMERLHHLRMLVLGALVWGSWFLALLLVNRWFGVVLTGGAGWY